jgi:hypothetical protein
MRAPPGRMLRVMRGLIIGAVVAGAGCVATDPTVCNEPLAVPGFSLYIHETPGLADGVYQWTVTADGATRVQDVTVVKGHGTCDCVNKADPTAASAATELSIEMNQDGAVIALLDDPLGGGRQAGPSHIAIRLARGAQTIATFTFDPVYRPVSDQCQSVLRSQYVANIVGP